MKTNFRMFLFPDSMLTPCSAFLSFLHNSVCPFHFYTIVCVLFIFTQQCLPFSFLHNIVCPFHFYTIVSALYNFSHCVLSFNGSTTLLCDYHYCFVAIVLGITPQVNISIIFSFNFEANASELK